ncbi:MAG: hypothetical protein ABFD89_04730 [Bryobacteraceae bacterium]
MTNPFANAPLPPHPAFRMGEEGVEIRYIKNECWVPIAAAFEAFAKSPDWGYCIGWELERACALAEVSFRDHMQDLLPSVVKEGFSREVQEAAFAEFDLLTKRMSFYRDARLAVRGMMEKEANSPE